MLSILLTALSHLPIVDLFAHGVNLAVNSGDVGGIIGMVYDVGQIVGALHLLAQGFVKVSEITPWEQDDAPAKRILGFTTSAMEYVARLMGALQKK